VKWLFGLFGRTAVAGDPQRVREVQAVLDQLRPRFRADGGDVRLLAVQGGTVRVRLWGACRSCAASTLTLRGALEPRLRDQLPWFERLESGS
jgi:Fe-S cluster biogenesis protein NfuA